MSAEFLGTHTTISDHDVTLTIAGEVESLRLRLIEAVQKLGYKVLGEQPIYAKRNAQCGARSGCSFEALDYPTELTIQLKQVNEIAVVATFNYEVKSYMRITKGDRQTLLREAEAIVALASGRSSLSACPSCATPVTDDSHFCRRCGAPLVIEVAELEVLRLTRKSRAAYHNVLMGVVILFITSLLLLPLFRIDPKAFKVMVLFVTAFGAFGLFALLQGIWQLHFVLNPGTAKHALSPAARALTAPVTQALPPQFTQGSITEGTTELLVPNVLNDEHQRSEPVSRRVQETGEIDVDEDRLM